LLDALSEREALPFVRRAGGLTVLHCAGEPAYAIDLTFESPAARADLVHADGLGLALIALSSPIGIERLPREDAGALIDAHLQGMSGLGEEFAPWGPVALDQPDPGDVDELLARGCVGISIPAGALAGPDELNEIEPMISRAEALGAPVFVHPGPAPGRAPREVSLSEPLWWVALTEYVAQMQAAWLTFATLGRREHPRLTVLFAMLAGGAPLLSERLTARGGPPVDLRDPLTFYETSSYGDAAIAAMVDRVGAEQLVYGSDRPVVEPVQSGWEAALQVNAGRFLTAGRHLTHTPPTVAVAG
jgi:hypothetical protein